MACSYLYKGVKYTSKDALREAIALDARRESITFEEAKEQVVPIDDFKTPITETLKDIGISKRNWLSIDQIRNAEGKIKQYNKSKGTSFSLKYERIGQSLSYRITEVVNNNAASNPNQLSMFATAERTPLEMRDDIKQRLIELLAQLGVSVQALEEALVVNGNNVLGLADFINKMVKVKEGTGDYVFTEEATHFITSILKDHPSVQRGLKLITKTQIYEDVKKRYEGVEGYTEEVMAKEALDQALALFLTETDKSLEELINPRTRNILQVIWDTIVKIFAPLSRAAFEFQMVQVYGDIARDMLSSQFDIPDYNAPEGVNILYNVELSDNRKKMKEQLEVSIKRLEDRLRGMKRRVARKKSKLEIKRKDGSFISQVRVLVDTPEIKHLENVIKQLSELHLEQQFETGMLHFLEAAEENIEEVYKYMYNLNEAGTDKNLNRKLTSSELEDLKDFVDYYQITLDETMGMLSTNFDELTATAREEEIERIDKMDRHLKRLRNKYETDNLDRFKDIMQPFLDRIPEKHRPNIEDLYGRVTNDINGLMAYAGSLRNAKDDVLKIAYKMVYNAKERANDASYFEMKRLVKHLENVDPKEYRKIYEIDPATGQPTGYFIRRANHAAYNRAKREFYEQLGQSYGVPSGFSEEERAERDEKFAEDPELKAAWYSEIDDWHNVNEIAPVLSTVSKDSQTKVKDFALKVKKSFEDANPNDPQHAEDLYKAWEDQHIRIAEYTQEGRDVIRWSFKYNSPYLEPNFNIYRNEAWYDMQKPENAHLKAFYDDLLDTKMRMDELLPLDYIEPFKLPQISKTILDRLIADGSKKSAWTEAVRAFRDSFLVRVDDTDYGENPIPDSEGIREDAKKKAQATKDKIADAAKTGKKLAKGDFVSDEEFDNIADPERTDWTIKRADGTQVNLVPIHYIRTLEEPSDISMDVISIMAQYVQMANNFKEIATIAPEIEVLKKQVENRIVRTRTKIKPKGASNAFQAIDRFADMQLYGRTKELITTNLFGILPEGKEWNVTKTLDKVHNYIRANNLINAVVTQTANLFSAEVFRKVEDFTGHHTTNDSSMHANKIWIQELKNGLLNEAGVIDKKSKLWQLIELNHLMNPNNRIFMHADKTRSLRLLNELPWWPYTVGDMKVKGHILMAMFDNYRLWNGKFVNRYEFRKEHGWNRFTTNDGLSKEQKAEIDKQWDGLREVSLWNSYEVGPNGTIRFKENIEKIIEDPDVEVFENRLQDFLHKVRGKMQAMASEMDGVVTDMDRAGIQKGAYMQLIGTHRGWLITGLQKRFKGKGFNFQTEEMDEGYYNTTFRLGLSGTIAKTLRGKVMSAIGNRVQQEKALELLADWNNLDDFERMNVLRVINDMAFIALAWMVAFILNAIANMSGDDDESAQAWAIHYMAYSANRVLLEVSALTFPFMLTELGAVLESPVAGARQLEQVMTLPEIFNWSTLESGPYEGLPRAIRKIIKLTPGLKGGYESFHPQEKNKYLKYNNLRMFPGLNTK